jgi:hypothetical protein
VCVMVGRLYADCWSVCYRLSVGCYCSVRVGVVVVPICELLVIDVCSSVMGYGWVAHVLVVYDRCCLFMGRLLAMLIDC